VTPLDLVIAAAVLAAACWLLVRSLRRTGGGCAGCSGGGCGRGPREPAALVRLGRGSPDDRGGYPTADGSG
jgi:hypothetical protein